MTASFQFGKSLAFVPNAGVGTLGWGAPIAAQIARARRRSAYVNRDGFEMESFGVEQLEDNFEAWRDLSRRALEPNAFLEPGFALCAARHSTARARPRFMAVWEPGREGPRRLVGLFPLTSSRPWLGRGLAALWLDRQAALAAPLLDRDRAVDVLRAFFDWFSSERREAGLLFPRIVKDGPIYRSIIEATRCLAVKTEIIEEFERAALLRGSDRDELWLRGSTKKSLKELHRRQRRLEEQDRVEFSLSSTPEETAAAAERFLILEASGWKKDTSFLSNPSLSTFLRGATRLLAQENKCRIASLSVGGRPIAMGVVIQSQDRAFFWKIAYDESFRSQAPGIHLTYELTQALASREDIAVTDSCAIANHPMIDKLWPDRLAICDLAAPLSRSRATAFEKACREERLRRNLRANAKSAIYRLLGRKPS